MTQPQNPAVTTEQKMDGKQMQTPLVESDLSGETVEAPTVKLLPAEEVGKKGMVAQPLPQSGQVPDEPVHTPVDLPAPVTGKKGSFSSGPVKGREVSARGSTVAVEKNPRPSLFGELDEALDVDVDSAETGETAMYKRGPSEGEVDLGNFGALLQPVSGGIATGEVAAEVAPKRPNVTVAEGVAVPSQNADAADGVSSRGDLSRSEKKSEAGDVAAFGVVSLPVMGQSPASNVGAVQSSAPPPLAPKLQEVVDQIVKEVYTVSDNGKTDTVLVLQYPPLFHGAQVTISVYGQAPGQLNIAFSNLTAAGQKLLDDNLAGLRARLVERAPDFVVQQLTTTTLEAPHYGTPTDVGGQKRDQQQSGEGGSFAEEERKQRQRR